MLQGCVPQFQVTSGLVLQLQGLILTWDKCFVWAVRHCSSSTAEMQLMAAAEAAQLHLPRSQASPSCSCTFPFFRGCHLHRDHSQKCSYKKFKFYTPNMETWIAVFVSAYGMTELLLKKNPLRFAPWVPKRLVPTDAADILTRTLWRTCIYIGTLTEKKERIYNKCIERNIRLNTDLATRIFSFPSQQGTLEKGKKNY